MPANIEQTRTEVPIRDFPGMKTAIDIHELADGSSHDQLNAISEDMGCLRTRRGYAVCIFEGE